MRRIWIVAGLGGPWNETGPSHRRARGQPADLGAYLAVERLLGVMVMKATTISAIFWGSAVLGLATGAGRCAAQAPAPRAASSERTPVLVELFTSEGCSSCPPADELLRKMDQLQPIPSAEIVVLSEHVDYYDHIGWKDPFSSHAYTERQQKYVDRMKVESPYTPQMVVDGEFQFNGTDAKTAVQDIQKAAAAEKISVKLTASPTNQKGKISINVQAPALPGSSSLSSADILIAVADDADVTKVASGENSGKTLTNIAVLRELKPVGKIDKANGFSKDVETGIPATSTNKSRIIVIVQEPHQGKLLGIASTQYPM
jgi:hypothetical protein